MKELNGWSIDDKGWLHKDAYMIEHGSSQFDCQNWSRIHFPNRTINEICSRDALFKNVLEVERRISTEEDFIVNGYHMYLVDGDAYYAAKTAADVLNYCHDTYGPIKDIYDCTEEEFLKNLTQCNLCENYVHQKQRFLNDDTGGRELKSYYDYYKELALEDKGCMPFIFFNV